MRVTNQPSASLIERADLEELVAERATDLTRHAEALGRTDQANVFWRLARWCRVAALTPRASARASQGSP